jgi:type II restriction/modification system DNA methylase subunit YeeA
MDTSIIPDHKIHVIARDDDYFFGLLHSRLHEVWTLATCSWIGKGNDPSYNSSTTFETFPFPYPPGAEPKDVDSPIMAAIVSAAQDLVSLRDKWLKPPQHPEEQNKTYWSLEPDTTDPSEDARTLTKLYNKRPAWLENAHQTLDRAVFAAYGLAYPLSKDEIIRHLLALNRERAAGHVQVLSSDLPPKKSQGLSDFQSECVHVLTPADSTSRARP